MRGKEGRGQRRGGGEKVEERRRGEGRGEEEGRR